MASMASTSQNMAVNTVFSRFSKFLWAQRRLLLLTFACGLGSISFGSAMGFPSAAIPDINSSWQSKFYLTAIGISFVVSSNDFGAFLGSAFGGYLMDISGRKASIMYVALPFAFGWLLIVASSNVYMLIIGRFSVGLSCGIIGVVVPVYIAEMSVPSIRGALCSFHNVFYRFGIVYANIFGIILSWKWLAVAMAILPPFMICFMFSMPESPRWLLKNGLKEEAAQELQWTRVNENQTIIAEEISSIEAAIKESPADFKLREFLLDSSLCHRLTIVMVPLILCILSGLAVMQEYTASIFSSVGSNFSSLVNAAIVGSVGVTANFIVVFFLDTAGRRTTMVISTVLTTLSLACLAAYSTISHFKFSGQPVSKFQWVPLFSLVLNSVAISSGFVSVPFCLACELFPLRARGLAVGISISSFNLFSFVSTFAFPLLLEIVYEFVVFWIFTGFAGLAVIFTIAFVPETKGKSLEELESEFK